MKKISGHPLHWAKAKNGGNHEDDFYDRRFSKCRKQNVENDGRI